LKQIDYLKLVATGRKSIHYARPSDADDALTGLAGICFVLSLGLIFAIAILASYLGEPMNADMLGWPLAATVLPGIAYFVCGIYIGGAPKLTRYCIVIIGAGVGITLSYLALIGELVGWYLFIPPFLFALLVSLAAVKQL
jgi:hypothetical protein